MELLAVNHLADGTIQVSLAHSGGLERLAGTPIQIAALCDAMEEMALLARASDDESAWLTELVVGGDVVRLGLAPGGRVRLRVVAGAPRPRD
jgi:hypothetical protein